MTIDLQPAEIDQIVREVVRRLAGSASTRSTDPVTQPATDVGCPIEDRVVTLKTIERITGAKRVLLRPDAVMTPSARDALRERGIDVVRQSAVDQPPCCLLVDPEEVLCAERTASMAERHDHRFRAIPGDCWANTLEKLQTLLAHTNSLGIVVTWTPATLTQMANRHSAIRAISGVTTSWVATATRESGANLLVLDAGRPSQELYEHLETFLASRSQSCA